jgi:hypothetical protein
MKAAATALARLTRVDLRQVFLTEAGDFTPWLAQAENLVLLGDSIGISMECESTEKGVGPFRADILCRDTANDNWVLIENQIEKTDHTHLGQLLTYAAGLDAVTIVWIADHFTPEHRAALDWLNEQTAENINFFGLEIELWQINESPVAPKFNVVCQPNDWSRVVKGSARGETPALEQPMQQYWATFAEHMQTTSKLRPSRPTGNHKRAVRFSLGNSAAKIVAILSTWHSLNNSSEPEIRVEIALNGSEAKTYFTELEKHKHQIEAAIGSSLVWRNVEGKNRCRIYISKTSDFLNESLWAQQHEWIKQNVEKFHKVFYPLVQNLKAEEADATDEE